MPNWEYDGPDAPPDLRGTGLGRKDTSPPISIAEVRRVFEHLLPIDARDAEDDDPYPDDEETLGEDRHAEFDFDDGYPSEATLERIRTWAALDFFGLMNFIRAGWRYADDYISVKYKNDRTIVRLSTAGWSGNEDIIHALQENRLFFSFYWLSSKRGGHYKFRGPPRAR